jgi:hypothetical protein
MFVVVPGGGRINWQLIRRIWEGCCERVYSPEEEIQ